MVAAREGEEQDSNIGTQPATQVRSHPFKAVSITSFSALLEFNTFRELLRLRSRLLERRVLDLISARTVFGRARNKPQQLTTNY